ncbi:MAG: fumarylacetoacetate hydrolase family protein [Acidobacteriota bacterium]
MIRLYRFEHGGSIAHGIERTCVTDGQIELLKGGLFDPIEGTGEMLAISDLRLLAPCSPSKIIAVGLNYREHAIERGKPLPTEPLLFLKPPSAVIGHGDDIAYPRMSKRVDYEGELGVVIGKMARHLTDSDSIAGYVLGYTCFNDVTARDLQDRDVQFTRAKGFDTFAAIGPCVAVGLDPRALTIETRLNGKVRQSSNTRNLIFPVDYLLRFISHVMTLYPGDVIATGTPSGIGPMSPGDRVEITIQGIGTLANTVMKVREVGQ